MSEPDKNGAGGSTRANVVCRGRRMLSLAHLIVSQYPFCFYLVRWTEARSILCQTSHFCQYWGKMNRLIEPAPRTVSGEWFENAIESIP